MEEQQYCNNHISQETAARNLLSKYIYNGRHKNDKIKKELVKTKPVFFCSGTKSSCCVFSEGGWANISR